MKVNELITGLLILTLFSCSNPDKIKETNNKTNYSEGKQTLKSNSRKDNTLDTIIYGKRVYIKDTTNYSLSFINELESAYSQYDSVRIIDDSLFLYHGKLQNQDKVFLMKYKLPTELELDKENIYSTKLNETNYTLVLKRINYTNLEYKLNQGNKVIKSGSVSMQGTFFFGPEGQPNEKGEPMFLHQYQDKSKCGIIIKVEFDTAERAVIIYCSNGIYEELPILRQE